MVNILREDQGELAMRFAGRHGEKFAGLDVGRSAEGDPVLSDALARVECRVRDAVTGGTHTVFFGEVQRAEASHGDPLAYFRGRFGRLSPELDLTELCEETFAARSAIELGVVELTVGKVGADAVAAPARAHGDDAGPHRGRPLHRRGRAGPRPTRRSTMRTSRSPGPSRSRRPTGVSASRG